MKVRPQQLYFQLYKNITQIGDTADGDNEINSSGYSFLETNSFLHLERIKDGMTSNVEMPMVVDFKELVYEQVTYSMTDLFINAGSYLVLFCLAVVLIFGCTGRIFVNVYISELKELIHRRYVEDSHSNGIKRLQKKFKTIHTALSEKKDDPSYKQTIKDLEMYEFIDL